MLSIDVIRLCELAVKIPAQIKSKIEADASAKLAYRFYEENIIDLAYLLIDKAIAENESKRDMCSWLHVLKGDLLIEKGMQLYQNKVECQLPFEKSIDEFMRSININPFNSVAWLGKSYNHLMIGLIYANRDKDETKGFYHFYQAISSSEAGLSALKEEGIDEEREQNLWAMKGAAYYLLDKDDEGNKCLEKAALDLQPTTKPS